MTTPDISKASFIIDRIPADLARYVGEISHCISASADLKKATRLRKTSLDKLNTPRAVGAAWFS